MSVVETEAARAAGLVTVPAVERALSILELLGESSDGWTLSEISKRLRVPKNAVFRITNTLRARGYLARDERTMRFTLTPKLLRFAGGPAEGKSLIEVSLDVMRELRDATGETVQIGRRIGTEGVVLDHVESLHPLRISVDAGLRFPLYNNAPGKLLLATLPEQQRETLIASLELAPCTSRTITDRDELRRECDDIVDRGYATDFAEADEGIHCVAAAVRRGDGEVPGVVWVSAPSRRLPKSAFARTGKQVMQAAVAISRRLQDQGR